MSEGFEEYKFEVLFIKSCTSRKSRRKFKTLKGAINFVDRNKSTTDIIDLQFNGENIYGYYDGFLKVNKLKEIEK